MFFKPAELQFPEVKPFDSFPVPFPAGSLSGVIFADELSEAVFIHTLLSAALSGGNAYHIGPGDLSIRVLEALGGDPSNLYAANVYSSGELLEAFKAVDEESAVIVRRFPLLKAAGEDIVEVRRLTDGKGLTTVLSHHVLELNELDLPGEFKRLFTLPELFDSLLVLRTSSYRGHYRMNVTVLRAPVEHVSSVGEHSIPIDSLVRPFLRRNGQE